MFIFHSVTPFDLSGKLTALTVLKQVTEVSAKFIWTRHKTKHKKNETKGKNRARNDKCNSSSESKAKQKLYQLSLWWIFSRLWKGLETIFTE